MSCLAQNNPSIKTGTTIADDMFPRPSCVVRDVVYLQFHIDCAGAYDELRNRIGVSVSANATFPCTVKRGGSDFIFTGTVAVKDVTDTALSPSMPGRAGKWINLHRHRFRRDSSNELRKCDSGYRYRNGASALPCSFEMRRDDHLASNFSQPGRSDDLFRQP